MSSFIILKEVMLNRIKSAFVKYNLDFWISVVGKTVMLIIAFISGFIYSPSYFSLAILYLFVLIVRIPSFFMNEKFNKKYSDNLELEFRQKHYISLYTSIMFFIWVAVLVPTNYFLKTEVLRANPLLLMYIVFVPWAVIRVGYEIYRIIKYRNSSDPYFRSRALVNIFCASVVVTKLFGDLYQLHTEVRAFAIVTTILALLVFAYSLTIFIYLIVISVRGLSYKRESALERFLKEKR